LRGHEERLVHQDSQVKRENWAYQDLPAILVLRERKETRAWKARMDTREKREIGYVTASLFGRSAAVCELEIPKRTTVNIYKSTLFTTGQSVKLLVVRYTTEAWSMLGWVSIPGRERTTPRPVLVPSQPKTM
jgi:hypothetical protein